MKNKQKFYTVWVGHRPGVYFSWEECKIQIHGFENAKYKSFPTFEEANDAFNKNSEEFIGIKEAKSNLSSNYPPYLKVPIKNSICVDGAYSSKTNQIEYQGVLFPNNEILFHAGPFNTGTNNIAEFLAIVHALSYCKKNNLNYYIYSDSQTAIVWVRKKKAATKIEISKYNEKILLIVDRAEDWLKNNDYSNVILKWETSIWGENPADFGRK